MNEQFEKDLFKKLYELCKRSCLAKLVSITKNRQDSEDLFAEAISIYWVKYKQGKIKNSKNIPAYVFTIAKNLHFTKMKSEIKTTDINSLNAKSEVVNPIWVQESVSNEMTEKIKTCLHQLNYQCRQLLIYKFVYHYTYEELAIRLKRKSADSLKTQTYRCLKKLKEMMMEK